MANPKQRRDDHLRRRARAAPRRRLIGALAGGAVGLLVPPALLLAWAAADGGLAEHGLEPAGGAPALIAGGLMLAVGVGFPLGLLGAVLARRLRAARGASWEDGATAFVGAFLVAALAALVVVLLTVR